MAGYPPIPASWSSEDALIQLYVETRRGRQPAAAASNPKKKSAATTKTNVTAAKPPALLASTAGGGGGGGGGERMGDRLVSPRAGGAAVGSHLLGTPPPAGRLARAPGERQFLYIQVCTCQAREQGVGVTVFGWGGYVG